MSDYRAVTEAMNAGTPPELICAACPWDRLCITPPYMTAAEVTRRIREAEQMDAEKGEMSVGTLMTAIVFAGRDTAAQLCPVFALKLRGPEGRAVADTLRESMRGEA